MNTELLFGPYRLPVIGTGDKVTCLARDRDVVCGGLVERPIGAWPRLRKTGRPALIVESELARAVACESEAAVAHWWGVSMSTVWVWRQSLGVGRTTEGTSRLLALNADSWHVSAECHEGLSENARSESGRAASSERRKGKPAHPKVKLALLRASRRKRSKQHKKSIADALRKRNIHPPTERPWTPDEHARLGTTLDRHVAAAIGRTVAAVRSRRKIFQIPESRHSRLHHEKRPKNNCDTGPRAYRGR
jgi:hypothetical protein